MPEEAPELKSLSLNELRGILSDEIHKIRTGQASAASVNAISNASGKILSSVKLEMEYYRLLGKPLPPIPSLLGGSIDEPPVSP